ncbi:MAG: M18 family aminopeptidase [Clostridia bacterium]|nr:M18 family aminopeptidase [Clostridia bacterium]
MSTQVQAFLDFISRSPSAFHAVHEMASVLEASGFARLAEHEAWRIVPGGKYYVTRNQSAIVAFAIPENGFAHFQIVASHSDSPTFKLKPAFEDEVGGRFLRLNTERYGGMIMSTWFDRPLSIAGRALVREGNAITTKLVDLGRDAVMIPNMPIHFNREVNDGYKYNPQVDLLPLYGGENAKGMLRAEIASACGAEESAVAGCDLFLYCRTPGSIWGAGNAFFSCPRIDDLECAYTSLMAFCAAQAKAHINVFAVMDNEEVGSGSKQGADSTFLSDVFFRVGEALGASGSEIRAAVASSFMVSADNAHAVHPNHMEKYDAQNRTYMNGGVVIKHNANQKYTTDAVSDAIFSAICEKAGVPVQHFSNRSDILGGSTLGNIANAHVSMNTVDIGLAQLAMHSSYETAGCADVAHMIAALTQFYRTDIVTSADGMYTLE